MPRPIYLLCCASNATDRNTNLLSLFNVVEEIKLTKASASMPMPSGVASWHPVLIVPTVQVMQLVSVWMKAGDDDPDQEFEVQFAIRLPKGPEHIEVGTSPGQIIRFTTPIHRVMVPNIIIPGFFGPGVMWVECRLRRAGESDWMARQEYPIILTEVSAEQLDEKQADEKKPDEEKLAEEK